MEEHLDAKTYKENRAKKFVKVLCILSLVSLGFGLLGVLTTAISGKQSIEQIEEAEAIMYQAMDSFGIQADATPAIQKPMDFQRHVNFNTFYLNLILTLLALSAGVFGVLKMLKMEKIGFHFYIIYCALPIAQFFIVAPIDLLHWSFFFWPIIISTLFLILYGVNVKYMK